MSTTERTTSWLVWLVDEVLDELAVDLQVVERQVLEVVERGEAGAEVVERELAADLAQPLHERLRLGDVHDRRRLGDLEDELAGVDAGAAEIRSAMNSSIGGSVTDVRRQVHLEADVATEPLLLGEQARPPGRRPSDRCARRGRGARRRTRKVPGGIRSSSSSSMRSKQLVAMLGLADQRQDRLGVQHEAIASRAPPRSAAPRRGSSASARVATSARRTRRVGRDRPPWRRTSRCRPRRAAPRRSSSGARAEQRDADARRDASHAR